MPDKTVVQKPVTNADLTDCHLYLVAGTPTWGATYVPKDATGAAIGGPRTVSGTVAYDPGLWAWVDAVVVAAINTQEGTA
jgi:hypothetical protein